MLHELVILVIPEYDSTLRLSECIVGRHFEVCGTNIN
jgi:hypothetical protein